MKHTHKSIVATVAVVALSLGFSAPATADEPNDTVQDYLAQAPGADRVLSDITSDATVSLPTSSADAITFAGANGDTLSVGLPDNAEFTTDLDAPLEGAPVVTAQRTQSTAPGAGAVSARAVIVVPDASAPSSYDFPVDVPEGTTAVHRPDGGIDLVAPAPADAQTPGVGLDVLVAQFRAPWAVDANGVKIPTSYSFDGSALTQSIDFSAVTAFPVVADPEVDWMGYFIRLTYSKEETRGMRDQGVIIGGILALGATIGAASGPAFPAVMAGVYAAGAAAVAIIATTASNAVGDGKCLQLDIPSMIPSIVKCRS